MTVGDIKQYRYSVETTIECSGHGSSGFLHDLLLTVARVNGHATGSNRDRLRHKEGSYR